MTQVRMPKLIAFDLDGTLTESKQALSPAMGELLSLLSSHLKIAVISGGSITQYKKQLLPFLSDEVRPHLFLLPTNGSQCFEYSEQLKEWTLMYEELFPADVKQHILEVLKEMIHSEEYDIPPHNEIKGEYVEDRGTQITFSAYGQQAPLELKKNWDVDQQKRLRMKEELEKRLPLTTIQIGGTTSIDILPKGFDKAKGLVHLIHRLEIDKKDVVFVGDAVFPGGNDYSPLEAGFETCKISGPDETATLVKTYIPRYT